MRKTLLFVAVLLALVGCSDDRASSGTDVSMDEGRVFTPEELIVPAGATVTWTNDSGEAHTVTAYEELLPEGGRYFASGGAGSEEAARSELEDGLISPGETFEVTVEHPGTYSYYCIPHEDQGMVGNIVVEE